VEFGAEYCLSRTFDQQTAEASVRIKACISLVRYLLLEQREYMPLTFEGQFTDTEKKMKFQDGCLDLELVIIIAIY
jgi:hypothetical protein